MIADRYVRYDVKRLIKDMPQLRERLKELKLELMYMDGAPQISYEDDKPSGTPSFDSIPKIVIKRDKIARQIQDYELLINAYDKAWGFLDDTERLVLTEFYVTGQTRNRASVKLQNQGLSFRTAERIAAAGLKKIRFHVFGEELY